MLNEQLDQLYRTYMPGLSSSLNKLVEVNSAIPPTHPLLLHLKDEEAYQRADLKVMIFGQETNDWEGRFGQSTVDNLYNCYDGFFHEGDCLKHGGHFWNSYKQYQSSIKDRFKPQSVSFVWNNILKVGNHGIGTPPEEIINAQMQSFPVLYKELEILDAHVLLFFTGPRYDRFLEMQFPGASIEPLNGFKISELAKISSEGQSRLMLRTYHPGYLYRRGKAYYERIQNAILNQL